MVMTRFERSLYMPSLSRHLRFFGNWLVVLRPAEDVFPHHPERHHVKPNREIRHVLANGSYIVFTTNGKLAAKQDLRLRNLAMAKAILKFATSRLPLMMNFYVGD
jgi:hypothetical protein